MHDRQHTGEVVGILCPGGCGETHPGWARYCHNCEGYLTDLAKATRADTGDRPEAARATGDTAPDDRPETKIRQGIVDMARAIGYAVWDSEQGYRVDGSTRVTRGMPDLILAGHGRTVVVEVKSARGRLTEDQRRFRTLWTRHGGTYLVWRSEADLIDWHEGRAER